MKIIGIAGSAKAGKSTCANFIVGRRMKNIGMIDEFHLNKHGKLMVVADEIQEDQSIKKVTREFESKNSVRNPEFELWAQQDLWPNVKIYSLADPLKFFLMDTFGLTLEQCFGGDKYTPTEVLWERVQFLPGVTKKKGPMTARELMEVVGSCFVRQLGESTFVDAALRKIYAEQPDLAIIDDVRADFEAAAIQQASGKIIRLTRGLSKNISEQTIDSIEPDYVLDNSETNITDSMVTLLEALKGLGYEV
jgi:hypothetical protein